MTEQLEPPLSEQQLAAMALLTNESHVIKAGPRMIAGAIRALATEVLLLRETLLELMEDRSDH